MHNDRIIKNPLYLRVDFFIVTEKGGATNSHQKFANTTAVTNTKTLKRIIDCGKIITQQMCAFKQVVLTSIRSSKYRCEIQHRRFVVNPYKIILILGRTT
jgi:hypothetical protein